MTRLDPTAVTPTVARQTPKNEFGNVLNQTLQGVVRAGGGVLNAAAGVPVISAAVASVTALANGTAQSQSAVTAVPGLGSAGGHAISGTTNVGARSFETSSKTGENVDLLFQAIARDFVASGRSSAAAAGGSGASSSGSVQLDSGAQDSAAGGCC